MIKIKNWLINLLDKLLAWLKKIKSSLETDIARIKELESKTLIDVNKTVADVVVEAKVEKKTISDLQQGEQFVCHYCFKPFALLAKDIFPTSVRLLYKDSYVTGKGVLCPHCFKTCITG